LKEARKKLVTLLIIYLPIHKLQRWTGSDYYNGRKVILNAEL